MQGTNTCGYFKCLQYCEVSICCCIAASLSHADEIFLLCNYYYCTKSSSYPLADEISSWPIGSQGTWTKYTPSTFLDKLRFALTAKIYKQLLKIGGASEKLRNLPRPLCRHRTNNLGKKHNPSRETVPLLLIQILRGTASPRPTHLYYSYWSTKSSAVHTKFYIFN